MCLELILLKFKHYTVYLYSFSGIGILMSWHRILWRMFFQFITHLFKKKLWFWKEVLCFLKIILECADGYFNKDCSGTCGNCVNGEVCEKNEGRCLNGCMTNYQQPLCKGMKINKISVNYYWSIMIYIFYVKHY